MESYNIVRKSIVAFIQKYTPLYPGDQPPLFPQIIGTGFFVHENGIIATNNHVIEVAHKLPKPPDAPAEDWPLKVLYLKLTEQGMLQIPMDIYGAFIIGRFDSGPVNYGSNIPDVAFAQVKVKGLPALSIENSLEVKEGMEVATAGFPMGTMALTAPGWLHQISPTLQKGIISSVLPFTCKAPHAYAINIMVQGGASGSPVFLPETGKVIGILFASLLQPNVISKDSFAPMMLSKDVVYSSPTNISHVVPAHIISTALNEVVQNNNFQLPQDTKSLDDLIANSSTYNAYNTFSQGKQNLH